jgi:acetaldehyde dehydrogenase (acetylating)
MKLGVFHMNDTRIRVAIIGTGNIGTDLAERLLKDELFHVVALVGRRLNSPGLTRFSGRIANLLSNGISDLSNLWPVIDGVFDATSASAHLEHWPVIKGHGKWAIDLTPSRVGEPFVPVLEGQTATMNLQTGASANYSMVTCGGQSSAPIIFGLAQHATRIDEIEVSSSIAALSAGPATRDNLDEYIDATENMTRLLTGCNGVKSILVLNPANPPVMMRTTVTLRGEGFDLASMRATCEQLVRDVRGYVPGYDLVVNPHQIRPNEVSATVKVEGAAYFLPKYAGNLDIINAAAVETARKHQLAFGK